MWRRGCANLFGHPWRIRLVDERRALILGHLSLQAGCFSTCRCGAYLDDLSEEARAHFIRAGRLVLDFKCGEWLVS